MVKLFLECVKNLLWMLPYFRNVKGFPNYPNRQHHLLLQCRNILYAFTNDKIYDKGYRLAPVSAIHAVPDAIEITANTNNTVILSS